MGTAERMAELERERADLRVELDLRLARLGAVEHELSLLQRGIGAGRSLTECRLTDAVLLVLREAPGFLSPSEIRSRLEASGRVEALNKVTATLNHLVSQEKVRRQGRGRYLAA
jgi:hypothetical protein